MPNMRSLVIPQFRPPLPTKYVGILGTKEELKLDFEESKDGLFIELPTLTREHAFVIKFC